MNKRKAVNVALPVEIAERLRREAFERRASQGSIVENALGLYWDVDVQRALRDLRRIDYPLRCSMCKRQLGVPGEPDSVNRGGDCAACARQAEGVEPG